MGQPAAGQALVGIVSKSWPPPWARGERHQPRHGQLPAVILMAGLQGW